MSMRNNSAIPLRPGKRQRGAALLAVLWLSAALSAIAFSLATTVRTETDRTSTSLDGLRAYYLATGAIERSILYMQWGGADKRPDGLPRYWANGIPRMVHPFPSGEAVVDVIPETAKWNINQMSRLDLERLLAALGVPLEQSVALSFAIIHWRSPGGPGPFDQLYFAIDPTFRARHASFEEIEELLLVHGMTPEIFYGTYEPGPGGQLVPKGGLRDCVSVFGSVGAFDINTAHPAVLLAAGVPANAVAAIVERRKIMPFLRDEEIPPMPFRERLRRGGNTIFTLRATARLKTANGSLGDLRRSAAATIKLMPPGSEAPYYVLRWYDQVWSN